MPLTRPDFIRIRPPPGEAETNENAEKIQFLKEFGMGKGTL